MTDEPLNMHAACEAGLEPVLEQELEQLGAQSIQKTTRGMSFQGDMELLWRANLECRTANRILWKLSNFNANNRNQLYDRVYELPWDKFISVDQTLAVDCRTHNSQLAQPQFVNQVVKDAICDGFRERYGRRPDVNRKSPDIPINVRLASNRCTISLDTSGARLHRRGYRSETGEAPLKETLAAGILGLAGWTGDTPLNDPMCGSGTFLIEGALMARRIAPGVLRLGPHREGFAFQRWKNHDANEFDLLVQRIRERELAESPVPIAGSDSNGRVIKLAQQNARRAGVADDITLAQQKVTRALPVSSSGTLITNPPYGVRLGEVEKLISVYKSLGDQLKSEFSDHIAWILVGDKQLANGIGLKATRRIALFNGAIDCRLMRYEMYSGSRKKKFENKES